MRFESIMKVATNRMRKCKKSDRFATFLMCASVSLLTDTLGGALGRNSRQLKASWVAVRSPWEGVFFGLMRKFGEIGHLAWSSIVMLVRRKYLYRRRAMRSDKGLRRQFQVSRILAACLAGGAVSMVNAAPGERAAEISASLPNKQCANFTMWYTTTKLPNGASPFSGYTVFMLQSVSSSTGKNLNDRVVVIDAEFPAAGYGGWFIYPYTYELATGGVTFPNVVPDAGHVNPYVVGNPIFASKRRYHLVAASDQMTLADLPANIRALLPENDSDAAKNLIFWPSSKRAASFALFNRTYAQYDGYTRGGFGGPLAISWPNVSTYDAKTGKAVPCDTVQVARDQVQQATPYNTVGQDGVDRSAFDFRGIAPGLLPGAPSSDVANSAPVPNPELVEFFRPPYFWTGWPGGVVPNPNQNNPDLCANYVVATLRQKKIALIRQPLVPVYAQLNPPRDGVTPTTQQVGALNLQISGRLRSNYKPGSPDTFAIGNSEIKVDRSGGATFLVWPTTFNQSEKDRAVKYAKDNGFNLLAGNLTSATNYLTGMIVRQNGPASNYYGGTYPSYDSSGNLIRTGVGCYLGPDNAAMQALGLTPRPELNFNQLGSEWAQSFKTSGPYAFQGVNCRSLDELESGRCLSRLKGHINDTGGEYQYSGPVPWVPPSTARQ